MSEKSVVKIDGSLGEGGGQVLRIALCLSVLYEIPIAVYNIRAGRPKPGLAAQHLKGVELLREMCNARVEGASIGSTSLEFRPGKMDKNNRIFTADTQTAGCICLLAQAALPCALFFPFANNKPVTVMLRGGTNVPMGPQIEHYTEVFRPMLNRFGADFHFTVVRRGYYPKGGGEVHFQINPIRSLKGITLTELGIPQRVTGWSYVAGAVSYNEAQRMANEAKKVLIEGFKQHNIPEPTIEIETYKEERSMAVGNGSGINLVSETSTGCVLGGSGLGSGKRDESSPGLVAANLLLNPFITGSCVDEYTQDQMVILMALAEGNSKVLIGNKSLTCHTETAIKVAEMMLSEKGLRFRTTGSGEGGDGPPYYLECTGCGLINSTE